MKTRKSYQKKNFLKEIQKSFNDSSKIILKSKLLSGKIESSIELIIDTLQLQKKIVIFGNGGRQGRPQVTGLYRGIRNIQKTAARGIAPARTQGVPEMHRARRQLIF